MNKIILIFSGLIWYSAIFTLYCHFMNARCQKKYHGKYYYYLSANIFVVVLMALMYHIHFLWLCNGIFVLLSMLYASIFYEKRNGRTIIRSALFSLTVCHVLFIAYKCVEFFLKKYYADIVHMHRFFFVIVSAVTMIIFQIFYRAVMMIYSLCRHYAVTLSEVISYVVVSAFSLGFLRIILLWHINVSCKENDVIFLAMMLFGMVIVNNYFLSYATYVVKSSKLEHRLAVEAKKNQMEYQYYKSLEVEHSECRKVLHDVKNHMQVLEALYQTDQKSAESYAKEMACAIQKIYPIQYSSCRMLNIILIDKKKQAEMEGIKVTYQVEENSLEFISDYELSTILCNIFDNAITECKKLPEFQREILFKLRRINEFIIFYTENPVLYNPYEKKRKMNRRIEKGTGLLNVCSIVEKYNGNCSWNIDDTKFSISISLCI